VISTIGNPFSGATSENDVIVTSEPIPFLLFSAEQTSINNLPKFEGISISPNPAMEYVILRRQLPEDLIVVELYERDGKLIFQKNWAIGDVEMQIPMNALAEGIFILTLINEQGTKASRYKIVKH
jgi:hypothetical protein